MFADAAADDLFQKSMTSYQYCKIDAGMKFPKQRKVMRRFGQILKIVKEDFKAAIDETLSSDVEENDADIEGALGFFEQFG